MEESTTNKIVFVDIDGVMIAGPQILIDPMSAWDRKFPATTIAVLNALCCRTGAKVVFNTSHNQPDAFAPDIEVAIVNHGLFKKHLHPTEMKTRYPHLSRTEAILDYVERNDIEDNDWIVLDDVLCADEAHMILIDPDAGLHVGHLNIAVRKLGGTPVNICY